MALSRDELLTLASQGAAARLAQLEAEIAGIRAAFPGLGRGRQKAAGDGGGSSRARKRRKMSAAARKKIGDAAKKRWAAWRAKNGKKQVIDRATLRAIAIVLNLLLLGAWVFQLMRFGVPKEGVEILIVLLVLLGPISSLVVILGQK